MKVLSIKEPFASLIKEKKKCIETRSWKTNYRGEIYIHASLSKVPKERFSNEDFNNLIKDMEFNPGHIICKCNLVDCIYITKEYIENLKRENYQEYLCGHYEEGRYSWVLEDVEEIIPVKAKGRLGIWNYNDELELVNKKIDLVIIGNTAYDVNTFLNRDGEEKKVIANKGGACLYSLIPASIFNKVGVVTKMGNDFEKELFDNNPNIDTTGLKVIDGPSNKFIHTYLSEDGQQRTFKDETNKDCLLSKDDIPSAYLNAKYIHVCTNTPDTQLELVKYLKENSSALISIDTHEEYVNDPKVLEVFNLVDIAFIDKEFKNLYDCNAKIKIFKQGKSGCHYVSSEKDFVASTILCDNVIDKTGAGDCVTGVFLALKAMNKTDEEALEKAVEVATESIKEYGMEHLLNKY